MTVLPALEPLAWLYWHGDPSDEFGRATVLHPYRAAFLVQHGWTEIPLVDFSLLDEVREALGAVEAAMLRGGNGEIQDHGWSITLLNKARPLVCATLAKLGDARHG